MSVPKVIFLGDSLTAGFGLDEAYSYPSIILNKIKVAGFNFKILNAGISGDTTAGGLRRLAWVLPPEEATEKDVLVLALGANDGLRGIDPVITKENLQKIILSAREINPALRIILAGMRAPPNMGEKYTKEYDKIYPELASEFDLAFLPFLLDGVAAKPELNLADGIHPNEKGYEKIAEMLWIILEPLLLE